MNRVSRKCEIKNVLKAYFLNGKYYTINFFSNRNSTRMYYDRVVIRLKSARFGNKLFRSLSVPVQIFL